MVFSFSFLIPIHGEKGAGGAKRLMLSKAALPKQRSRASVRVFDSRRRIHLQNNPVQRACTMPGECLPSRALMEVWLEAALPDLQAQESL